MTRAATRAPRPVYCATEHLHRDLALARDVCAGRFTLAGSIIAVDIPRWRDVDVHGDREWWIEWIKFYYGLDLAFAFTQTGDPAFLQTWQRLVESWIAQVAVGFGPTDACGRRLQNWIYAWSIFERRPGFTGLDPDFAAALVDRIAAEADHLRMNLTAERNHRTLELYALLIVALALPELDADGSRLRCAWRELHANLLADFRPDGVHREQSTHYHMVALRSFVAARENARRFGLTVAPSYDERLARAVEFARCIQRPDGSIPALSDSDTGDYRETLALAADLLGRTECRRGVGRGTAGAHSSRACRDFPHAGYYVQRTASPGADDAPDDQRHLIFDCGPIGDGGHGHYDLLSIDVWAGRPIVVDPGRYTYAEGTPNWRHWFKSTRAHNTVCVDGRDQTAYRPGKPKTTPAQGRPLNRMGAPFLQVIGGEAISSEYDAVHRRHVFFVAEDYWIVLDELEALQPHDYDLRFHLAPCASGHLIAGDKSISAPGVDLLFAGHGDLTIEDGWVAPGYGRKAAAPVVSFCARGRHAARFVTAIVPVAADTPAATARRLSLTIEASGVISVALSGTGAEGSCVDHLWWQPGTDPDRHACSSITPTASWTRTSDAGVVLGFSRCESLVDDDAASSMRFAAPGVAESCGGRR